MRTNKSQKQAEFFESLEQVIGDKKKYPRKKYYPYKLYIAENLEIDKILADNPPEFKYHRDCFVYVLHLIVSIPSGIKDYNIEKYKGFTPIDKVTLRNRIHNYRQYIDCLKTNGIIKEGTSYKAGYYSRGLKYTEQYRTKIKRFHITKNTLIKSITEKKYNRDVEAENKLHFLKGWFNKRLTIDMQKVKQFLDLDKEKTRQKAEAKRQRNIRKRKYYVSIEEIVISAYNMKYIIADKIDYGKNFNTKVDTTSGRFHSPLVQLKSELRSYVKYDGKTLVAIDIVNSQPLLAIVILDWNLFKDNEIWKILSTYNQSFNELKNINKLTNFNKPSSTMLVNLLKKASKFPDIQQFKNAVIEGRFYEFFGTLLQQKGLLPSEICSDEEAVRKYAKRAIFTAFFSRVKDVKWNKDIQAFRKCFPTVFRIFTLIKTGKHNTLACLLQRFESNLVLHKVCVEINESHPGIPLFTIHDSIVTTEENLDTVKEIFERNLLQALGAMPKLKIEKWQ